MGEEGDISVVWKTVALVLVTVLLTGTPGIIYALRTWSVAEDVTLIRDRQDNVRDRLATLEAHMLNLESDVARVQQDIDELAARLDTHVVNDKP
jgi:hypothetical protein